MFLIQKQKLPMKLIVKKNRFDPFARIFRDPLVVALVIFIQFVGIEIAMLLLWPDHLPIYERVAFYGTLLSSAFALYASVGCRSYVRRGGDEFYKKIALSNIEASVIIYFIVLLFIVAISLS